MQAVSEISSQRGPGHSWGLWATAVARVASRMARRNRLLTAAVSGARLTLNSFGRVLHLLWLEVTGLFFVAFAVIGGVAAYREYPRYAAGKIGPARLIAAVCFSVLFAWFAVTSFWRARRK